MKKFFERAVANITAHGDTDIFPFPIENHLFYDKPAEVVALLLDIDNNFHDRLAKTPPSNYSALTPVSYTGFRWATQIDPLWNAYLLGVVLSIADAIETARVSKADQIVFSYRFNADAASPDLFQKDFNWRSFMERSLLLAQTKNFVITCDISEFYSRLNHHRLENALKQLGLRGNQSSKIMDLLQNFSGTYSFGMPVGGPAARILSELLLNQIDSLLRLEGIEFCRFADDYHLFSDSYGAVDITHVIGHFLRLMNNMGHEISDRKGFRDYFSGVNTKAGFVVGGYSHQYQSYQLAHILFRSSVGKFVKRPAIRRFKSAGGTFHYVRSAAAARIRKPRDSTSVCVVGDYIDQFLERLSHKVRSKETLGMEPLEVLIEMLNSGEYEKIGGAPQVVKAYKHLNTLPMAILWKKPAYVEHREKAERSVFVFGRPLMHYERSSWPILDPNDMSHPIYPFAAMKPIFR